ncbi:nitroreductase family protein [Dactylosporangium aurantiacum]|uniref:Nitroreductase family protein n=1 Tax=Dactylosporangium aurantiacum TaxID=35754 RepID=A0A9Q9IR65_9ACTN|nr:nitroreductase family protein [Dactylosporangium aurantiacum]MDG6110124.1 nitroreductase family protein [Dactylosporangium aurantiacum]UWZ57870.1 nitroreductase family protein [Dactylosporangium aurantiacum]
MDDLPDTGAAPLFRAAAEARLAPSILNTQPWRWHVDDRHLDLYADPQRQLTGLDPDGRLLVLSCGAALQHAEVSLAARGYEPAVQRTQQRGDDRWLARVGVGGRRPVRPEDVEAWHSMRQRCTDRRPFRAATPVPEAALATLCAAAETAGAWLHRVEPEQVRYVRAAAQGAQRIEDKDQRSVQDLREWAGRDPGLGDGLPAATVVAPVARPVPLRSFGLEGEQGERTADPGPGDDHLAEYLIIATTGDDPVDWLRAGEATSAVWLAATTLGLAVSPLSDVVEVPGARVLLRSLLHRPGHPQLVLRVGAAAGGAPPAAARRRRARDVIRRDRPAPRPRI